MFLIQALRYLQLQSALYLPASQAPDGVETAARVTSLFDAHLVTSALGPSTSDTVNVCS
jgi:hypothetical protein